MSTCDICNKEFNSNHALAAHRKYHFKQNHQIYCSCIYTREKMLASNLSNYQKQLIPCKKCGTLFKPSNQKSLTACSRSCATSLANVLRGKRSEETKQKISEGLRTTTKRTRQRTLLKEPKSKTNKITVKPYYQLKQNGTIVGPHTKLFYCRCKHCSVRWYSRTMLKYCKDHVKLYSCEARTVYKFTFNVYHYPDLFDLTLLKEKGWYSPGGKSGKWNPTGLSRDHKISVNEAILNGYDPYYIKHPLNCELLPQTANNSKKTKCSVTYIELVRQINEYDSRKILVN